MDKPKLPENYSAPVSIKPTRVLIREREERAMTDIDRKLRRLTKALEAVRDATDPGICHTEAQYIYATEEAHKIAITALKKLKVQS